MHYYYNGEKIQNHENYQDLFGDTVHKHIYIIIMKTSCFKLVFHMNVADGKDKFTDLAQG